MKSVSSDINALLNQGHGKHKAGDLAGALADYEQVLRRNPDQPDALWLKGTVHIQSGEPALAVDPLEKALTHRPQDAAIWNNLGVALQGAGHTERAKVAFRRAVGLDRGQVSARVNLARFTMDDGDPAAALQELDHALEVQPFHPDAHHIRALALRALGRPEEALDAFDQALEQAPGHPEFLLNKGILLQEGKKFERAREALEEAVRSFQTGTSFWADATMTLGLIAAESGDLDGAIKTYDRILAHCPDHGTSLVNRGDIKERLGQLESAEQDYQAALQFDISRDVAKHNMSRIHLLRGEWVEGWDAYELRWQIQSFESDRRDRDLPRWDGTVTPGFKLLVWGEQGIGDQILFGSLLNELEARGVDYVLEVNHRLAPLFARAKPAHAVYAYEQVPEDCLSTCHAHIPIGSLAQLYRRATQDFTETGPWIASDAAMTADLKKKYADLCGDHMRVGISWYSTNPKFGAAKTMPLTAWAPIFACPNVSFFSLQYGDIAAEVAQNAKDTGVAIYVDPDIDPMVDLDLAAAQVAAMDVVVSTAGTAVHLAAAQGKETWVMIPEVPEWRWGLNSETSLWYPSVRLFRQQSFGDWSPVADEVARSLSARAER